MKKSTRLTVWAIGLIVFALFPKFFGIYYSNIIVTFAVWALFAVSLNMMLGFTGLLSFGHAMYFGTGAYGTALALTHMDGLPLIPAVLSGGVASMVLAICIAPLVVRVSGTAFAMLHLAFAQFMFVLALKLRDITGGEDGLGGFDIPPLQIKGLFSVDMADPLCFFYFAIAVIVIALCCLWFVTKTPFGQIMVGTRDNAKRIDYLGFRVSHTKAIVYIISAAAAGVAGSVSVLHQNLVSANDAYGMMISVFPIMMAMVGGARSFFGPIYGAAFFAMLEEFTTRYTDHFELILGVVLVVFIMYWPLGFAGMIMKLKYKWLTWKQSRKSQGSAS